MSTVKVIQTYSDVTVRPTDEAVKVTVSTPLAPQVSVVGEQGPRGVASAETLREYTHQQPTPELVWDIAHNLGFRPAVYVTDSAGDECEGNVDHLSSGRLTITFSAAFSGTARLS